MTSKNHSGPLGSSSIPPETVTLGKWYSFSFNLSNLKGQLDQDYRQYYTFIQKRIRPIKSLEYSMVLEYSKFGRLHCHGRVKFSKTISISYWYEFLYDIGCNFEFDTIAEDSGDKWTEYMFKGKWYMQPRLEKMKVEYELTDSNMPLPSGEKKQGPLDRYM